MRNAPKAAARAEQPAATSVAAQPRVAAAGEDPAASDTQELERQMYEIVNSDRLNPSNAPETRGQAKALAWNEQLAEMARAYSEEMAKRGFFDHVSPEGVSPDMRLNRAGIVWQAEGENIAKYHGVAAAETAFMNEPRFQSNHRANILDADFTDVGIGIVKGPDGMYYITQEFIGAPHASHPQNTGSSASIVTGSRR